MIRKQISFPLWVEAILILVMAGMAFVEGRGGSWGWAIVFGVGSVAFGISAAARAFSGEGGNHGGS